MATKKRSAEEIELLKSDLKAVLEKHGVSIGFTCGDGSDTHGLYDDQLVIEDALSEEVILEISSWWLTANDLK